eukprot:CAMPEP_0171756038 /NCGR_PEP_ID=MMETSP0991-20121206/44823_1 /TAXON_ID=483369 /ORGANISM="non described non described, Strain CCMP2098" /LENGTH=467 /DNA_ID=CAMNT_0012358235 /DNA_START=28 /DNA_END=1432 /DNA_ORIENTATION=-
MGGESEKEEPLGIRAIRCVCWYLAFPFMLVFYSLQIYLFPCIGEYLNEAASWCCFSCLSSACGACCGDMRHTDKSFPPEGESLGGKWKDDKSILWKRSSDVVLAQARESVSAEAAEKLKSAHLFEAGISPSDIAQGQLGDCWLLSAIATLAEKSGQIEQIFKEKTHSVWGKYHLKLYNGKTKTWSTVTIDDFVPVQDDKPLFTKPKGNEMWVLLLEKAFAKLVGDYADLEGGMPLWALEVMTGDKVSHFQVKNEGEGSGLWQKMELVHFESDEDGNRRKVGLRDIAKELYSTHDFFDILEAYEKQDAALAAYSKGKSDKDSAHGIVEGHAYSILAVKHVGMGIVGKTRRFLRLRNPWGTFEWDGAWSDKSPLWKEHPDVASALHWDPNKKEDGAFWMTMEDFMLYFDGVDILDRGVNIKDVVLTIDESEGCLAPLKGCAAGASATGAAAKARPTSAARTRALTTPCT